MQRPGAPGGDRLTPARAMRFRRPGRQALLSSLALLAGLLIGAGLLLAEPAWLLGLRHAVFDQYQRLAPRPYQPAAVLVLDIDEESLARHGQWPWPRTRLADMVDRLTAAQVSAIGFDVVFAEPDRTAPAALAEQWQLPAPARQALAALPDPDRSFAAAIARANVVLGFALSPSAGDSGSAAPAEPPYRWIQLGAPAAQVVHRLGRVVPPLPLLAQAAHGSGALAFVPDPDGVVRRVPLVLRTGDVLVPTLISELLRVGQGERNYLLRSAPGSAGLAELRVGALALPTTREGELWVHYGQAHPDRTLPAWKLLAGAVSPGQLAGKLVLIGSSAQGLMDLRFGVLGGVLPGVEIQAQALEQVLGDTLLLRPAWARGAEALLLAAGGMLLGGLAMTAGALVSAAAALLALAALLYAGWVAFAEHRLLLDPVTPALGWALAYLGASVLHHAAAERRQRWLRQAFARYVSPNRVAHMVAHPEELALGGQRRVCSFVFTDLANFTPLMEKSDPGAAVALLNAYLDAMVAIAFRHHGTLDRIIGDAVAIMFSAPEPQADHCRRAWDCALEMQRFASAYAAGQRARGLDFGDTRIGVHSGEVIVGNFGGSTMFDYRALGDAVNTAARLEGANKYLGTLVCVSQATLDGCPGVAARPIGRVRLKGKSELLGVYEPVDPQAPAPWHSAEACQQYAAAYALLQAGDAGAPAAFDALAGRWPDDPLPRLHLRRLSDGARDDAIVLTDK